MTNKQPIIATDCLGTVKFFNSVMDASRELEVNEHTIFKILRGVGQTAGRNAWKFTYQK